MEIDKTAIPTLLLWVDLEMTGLQSKTDRIIEVAAEVTDFEFKTLASYEAVIHYPEDVITTMNDWSADQHAKSGLIEKIRNSTKDEDTVVREFAAFIKENFKDEPAILAGNSIHNDREFIKQWWQPVEDLLHYRMLDVSSFKIVMQGKFGIAFNKNDAHRAFDDIQASIAELQYYLEKFQQ